MTRILNVFQSYALFGKGNQAAKVQTISKYLLRRGHEVEILAVDFDRRFASYAEDSDGVRVDYVGAWLKARNVSLSLDAVPFLLRRVKDFDIVHIYGIYDLLGIYAAAACQAFGVPYVVEPMGMYVPIVRSLGVKKAYHKMFGRLIGGGAALIATSEQEAHELESQGIARDRIVVRLNGLDLGEFESLPPRGTLRAEIGVAPDAKLALYFGRLAKKKGLDLLTHAFADLPGSAHLAIVGPDEHDGTVEAIDRIRRERGVEGRVHVAGARFGRARLEALVDADAFVLPSINENFGNVVAEAIACGVPAVVTEGCGIAEYVKDRAARVASYDRASLARAMNEVLFDERSRAELVQGTAAVTRELSWDPKIDEMVALYTRICGEGPRRNRAHSRDAARPRDRSITAPGSQPRGA